MLIYSLSVTIKLLIFLNFELIRNTFTNSFDTKNHLLLKEHNYRQYITTVLSVNHSK